eukprot:GEMP01011750.1.p1 GENE.GEMP01011750.1~~GEMP01011750.1.p1  ORF type:complete len:443 (+),score=66.14 GEMP01011750.1:26-1330(+)
MENSGSAISFTSIGESIPTADTRAMDLQTDQHTLQSQVDQPFPTSVTMSTRTWTRESHGLFDYESTEVVDNFFHMLNSFSVVRHEAEILVNEDGQGREGEESLAQVYNRGGQFYIDRPAPQMSESSRRVPKLWRVVEANKGGLRIREGDQIKLARFKLKVRHLAVDSSVDESGASEAVSSSFNPKFCFPVEDAKNLTCRICLMEGSEEDDPLIRPCACKGSIEAIHLQCLRHWINGRLQFDGNHDGENVQNSYVYRPLNCELCKTAYATHMRQAGKEASDTGVRHTTIVELPKTRPPYIVLEKETNRPEDKGIYVVSLADKHRLKIGRGHESDARFADVSISRWHATILFNPETKEFRMEDNNSKFGTLVALKGPLRLDEAVRFQAGRTVLEFEAQTHAEARKMLESQHTRCFPAQASSDEELMPVGKDVETVD